MERSRRLYELIVSVLIMVVSAYLLIVAAATKTTASPGMMSAMDFPKIILMGMLALSGFLTVKGLFAMRGAVKEKLLTTDRRVWYSAALILCYALIWRYVSFSLATFLYIGVQAKVLDKSLRWSSVALISLLSAVTIVLVFRVLFHVSLSESLLVALGLMY
jgi:hypothetical protein